MLLGHRNIDTMNRTQVPKNNNVESIIALSYKGIIIGYRVTIKGSKPVDISREVVRAFGWLLNFDRISFVRETEGLIATQEEIDSGIFVLDISTDFNECYSLFKILKGNDKGKDEFTIESLEELAKQFYEQGGKRILDQYTYKDKWDLVIKDNILEGVRDIFSAREGRKIKCVPTQ